MSLIGKTFAQAAAVVAAGILLGLLGNALSPVGLSLKRNYFPLDPPKPTSPATPAGEAAMGTTVPGNPAAPIEAAPPAPPPTSPDGPARLSREEVEALFNDPRRLADLVVFIDARDQAHFEQGHIPGAFLFDHYRPEEHLAEVLPVCQTAEVVVVYCNGGDCEDSLFAAHTLKEQGASSDRLRVYEGGFQEWRGAGLPVEIGPRLSGMLENPSP